jgi:anti-repressor protein
MKLSNLIKISDKGLVSAKELYLGLGLNRGEWSRWYPSNIEGNEFFKENTDWTRFVITPNRGGKPETDFAITIEFAKHIAMMARTEKSHEYRNYFIQCERKINQQQKPTCIEDVLIQSLQEMKDMRLQIEEAKKQTSEVKEEVRDIRNVITLNPQAAWRRECNRILNAIGRELGDYKTPKDQVYEALKNRGKCRPNVLVLNLKKRAAANGMAPSRVEKLNILDVLENEPRLKEIYISIVKEMAIKNGVRIREEAAI